MERYIYYDYQHASSIEFRARWRENRTIFNTPNPRLANASLLKEVTKQSVGQPPGSRRGSLTMRNGGSSSLASIPRSLNNDVSGSLISALSVLKRGYKCVMA